MVIICLARIKILGSPDDYINNILENFGCTPFPHLNHNRVDHTNTRLPTITNLIFLQDLNELDLWIDCRLQMKRLVRMT